MLQSHYGDQQLCRVGLQIILCPWGFFNMGWYLRTWHWRFNVSRGGWRVWAMFTSPTVLVSSARDRTRKSVLSRPTKLPTKLPSNQAWLPTKILRPVNESVTLSNVYLNSHEVQVKKGHISATTTGGGFIVQSCRISVSSIRLIYLPYCTWEYQALVLFTHCDASNFLPTQITLLWMWLLFFAQRPEKRNNKVLLYSLLKR